MDKIATNNFIVSLGKDVKAAKSMVAGNLTRKIVQAKKELEKQEDEAIKAKLQAKIDRVHADVKKLKTLDNYIICKKALLKPDGPEKYWANKIGDSKASNEECLEARVISKSKIQKQVQKFRSQNADCDEWLEEYFEFREKKRELMEATQVGRKKKMRRERMQEAREKRIKARVEKRAANIKSENETNNEHPANRRNVTNDNKLHPSWASKRREKEMLKKAFTGIAKASEPAKNRVVLNAP